ncbi:MAG TPA: hypothetical protein ENG29_02785 [Firmicutes bacterium]|nr:MAG: hypothetical protein DRH51_06610 [Candidatus Coatesbacteria bacterium]HDM43294.1 hypothetical protein [Bacillota bacterium]
MNTRTRRIVLITLILCILGLFTYIYLFSDVGYLKIIKLENKKKNLETRLKELKRENEELNSILNDEKKLNEYIDMKLREDYGMIKDGETIIMFDDGKTNAKLDNSKDNN